MWTNFAWYQKQSVRCGHKRGHRRDTGKHTVLYSYVLDKQGHYKPRGRHMEEEYQKRGVNQADGEPRERVRTCGKCLYWESGTRGFYCCVWWPLGHWQGRARRGTWGRDQPYHTDTPGPTWWCVPTRWPGCRDAEAAGKCEASTFTV